MSKSPKTLVLLDAHAIIHRAFHALPEFLSSKGEPTGALYGLSSMLMKIVTDLKPDYIVACYDLPGKTFRHIAYDGYKAGRAKADDGLILQLKNSRAIFEAFNIPVYDSPGFEADDVLGTICEKYKKDKNINIIIASGDMDTMQLIDDKKVQVYTLKKGINETILYDEDAVISRFHFKPKFLPDYKGLRGDSSDNIVGIKGIGEKSATILIETFCTIPEIYKKISSKGGEDAFKKLGFSDRIIKLLKDNEEEALFSKTLAKIRTDAPISFVLPNKTFWELADFKKIEQLFIQFEFRSLFSRLKNFFANNSASPVKFSQVLGSPVQDSSKEQAQPDQLENLLGSPSSVKLQEASIALWLINSDISNPNLSDILMFARLDPLRHEASSARLADADSFDTAYERIFKTLKEKKLEKVYEEIERPIMHIVKKMEDYGILIDKKYFENLSIEYHKELDRLTQKIYKISGTEFNINSPKQLGEVLFGKMGMKSNQKRKRLPTGRQGSFSTKVSVLEELGDENPIIKEILAYRELQKLLSTYIDVIPKMAGGDGRLHAKFLQNGTTTGRFSSQDPNLQNLPIKTELGKRIRGGFIAQKGSKLLAFDYSQIELRVAAILSGDKKMTQIFRDRKDIHSGVASFVFGAPIDKVDSEMRRKAKVINFGIIYGMGVSALRKNLGGTREEAQKFYDNYFNQFSGVRDYLEEVKKFALKNSFTETLFGRRRYFPNINSKIPFLKNMAERTATNAPIQGTATADIIKLAIRYIEEDLKKTRLLDQVHLVLQIHDELVYEVEEGVLLEADKIIKNAMRSVLERSYIHYKTEIPLEVHSGYGDNFGEVK
ncbi:MAG: polymerase protein [Candidatus Nomurabacteria bacterium GW2011_GWA1_37_20]|uniref:DNA-directed DNA polymerase n=2 Tax=Parcubacteria group TaxID=1794811 RepID=A0A0G0I8F8_9BACT|nr:MAG: polymerase protein [Candidatus Nomurabacteria bacterium GW2011_GWA1_37_20]KKQ47260.1 MAG: polymerase protein [Candidatus Yanofskybacteria bacterium GW2011_GWC2_37_9]